MQQDMICVGLGMLPNVEGLNRLSFYFGAARQAMQQPPDEALNEVDKKTGELLGRCVSEVTKSSTAKTTAAPAIPAVPPPAVQHDRPAEHAYAFSDTSVPEAGAGVSAWMRSPVPCVGDASTSFGLIDDTSVIERLLTHVGLPTDIPEVRSARPPPTWLSLDGVATREATTRSSSTTAPERRVCGAGPRDVRLSVRVGLDVSPPPLAFSVRNASPGGPIDLWGRL